MHISGNSAVKMSLFLHKGINICGNWAMKAARSLQKKGTGYRVCFWKTGEERDVLLSKEQKTSIFQRKTGMRMASCLQKKCIGYRVPLGELSNEDVVRP